MSNNPYLDIDLDEEVVERVEESNALQTPDIDISDAGLAQRRRLDDAFVAGFQDNEYLDIDLRADDRLQMEFALRGSRGVDPKARGHAFEIAEETGLPTDMVFRGLPDLKEMQTLQKFPYREVQLSPTLKNFFSSQDGAITGSKGVEDLLNLHKAMRAEIMPESPSGPALQVQPRIPDRFEALENTLAEGATTAFITPDVGMPIILDYFGAGEASLEQHDAWRKHLDRAHKPTHRPGFGVEDVVGPFLQIAPTSVQVGISAAEGAGVGILASKAIGRTPAGRAFLAGTGSRLASGISIAKIEGSAFLEEAEAMTYEDGSPIPNDVKAAGALVVMAINTGLEYWAQMAVLRNLPGVRSIPGIGTKAIRASVMKTMLDKSGAAALLTRGRKALGDWTALTTRMTQLREALAPAAKAGQLVRQPAKDVAKETATEPAQEFTNIEVGRGIRGEDLALPWELTREERDRLFEAGVTALIGTIPLVGGGAVLSRRIDKVNTAKQNKARIEAIRKAVEELELKDISPRMFRQLTDGLAEEAGIERIGIPAERLLEVFDGDREALFAAVPEARDQLDEALPLNGDIRMSVGRFLSGGFDTRTGTPMQSLNDLHGDELVDDLRLRQGDLTNREGEAQGVLLPDNVEAALAREDLTATEGAAASEVMGRIEAMALEAGLTPEEAQHNALIFAAEYTESARRARAGGNLEATALSEFEADNLTIRAEEPQAAPGEAISPEGDPVVEATSSDLALGLLELEGGNDVMTGLTGVLTSLEGQPANAAPLVETIREGFGEEQAAIAQQVVDDYNARVAAREEQQAVEPTTLLQTVEETDDAANLGIEPQTTKAGKMLGVPEWIKTKVHLRKARKLAKQFVAEGEAGRFWYEESGRKILGIFNGDVVDAEIFVQLLAIYSPQTTVPINAQFAIRALTLFRSGVKRGDFHVSTKSRDAKAIALLFDKKPFAGRKTNSFYLNLMHQIVADATEAQFASMKMDDVLRSQITQTVTSDVWVFRGYGYEIAAASGDLGSGRYSFTENEFRRMSAEFNAQLPGTAEAWLPHQVQAAFWTAVKARFEVPEVRAATIKESVRKGFSTYERGKPKKDGTPGALKWVAPTTQANRKEHDKIWRKHALRATPEQVALAVDSAKASFSDALQRLQFNVTWEAIPSKELLHPITTAPTALQRAFSEEAAAILVSEDGTDQAGSMVGAHVIWVDRGNGGYERAIVPNLTTRLIPNKPKGDFSVEEARLYTRILQYVYKQDSVPFFRSVADADFTGDYRAVGPKGNVVKRFDTQVDAEAWISGKDGFTVRGGALARGVTFTFDGPLAPEVENRFFLALQEAFGPGAGYTKTTQNEIVVINYRSEGLPFLTDDDTFVNALHTIGVQHGEEFQIAETTQFGAAAEYGAVHDWDADPTGESLLDPDGPLGSPDIHAWLSDRREAFEAILERYDKQAELEQSVADFTEFAREFEAASRPETTRTLEQAEEVDGAQFPGEFDLERAAKTMSPFTYRLYRGAGDPVDGGSPNDAMFGEAIYYADTLAAAEVYAEFRENGRVEQQTVSLQRPFYDVATTEFDSVLLARPEYVKLEQILAREGLPSIERLSRPNGFGLFLEGQRVIDSLGKAGRREAPQPGVWAGAEEMRQLIEEAGFDGIVGALRDVPELPSHVQVAVFKVAEDAVTLAQAETRELLSEEAGGVRGSITFDPELNEVAVRFFAARNESTLLHEGGHLWFQRLQNNALANRSEQDVRDWAIVAEWLGVEPDATLSTEHHERLARAMEGFFQEGKAPTPELQPVFTRFKEWLREIYDRSLSEEVGVTDELRGVMGRLFSGEVETEQAVDVAQAEMGFDMEAFPSPEIALMTHDEWDEFKKLQARARGEASEALVDEARARERKRLTAKWRKDREDVQTEVEAEIKARRVYQARHWLQTGEFLVGPTPEGLEHVRMDRREAIAIVSEHEGILIPKQAGALLPRMTQERGGMHPDLVAEMFGYESGAEMIAEIVTAEDIDAVIEVETDALMEERFGELDSAIEDAAIAAVENSAQMQVLQVIQRSLNKRVGGKSTPMSLARKYARRIISSKRVADINPHTYRVAAQQAGRLTVEAVAAGDFEEAHIQNTRQILNTALEAEARNAKKEIDRIKANQDRYDLTRVWAKIGLAGEQYQMEIAALRDRFDFRRSPTAADKRALSLFIQDRLAENEEVVIPEWLENESFRLSWKELSLENLRALDESVRNIEHLAKLKVGLIDNQRRRKYEEIEADIIDEMEESVPIKNKTIGLTPNEMEEAKTWAGWVDASLSKVEFMIDILGGFNPNSTLRRVVWEPLVEAQQKYRERVEDYSARLELLKSALGDAAVREYGADLPDIKLRGPNGENLRWTKWNVIMAALNLGNASNKEKMLKGYGWTEAQLREAIDVHMEEQDWVFVQGVLDTVKSLWPEISELEQRVSGIKPPKVQNEEIVTPFGTFRGGYFPVVYDSRISRIGQRQDVLRLVPGASEGVTRATTGHSHTKERTKVTGPVKLDQSVITSHIDQVLLDLTHREAIINAGRVLGRQEVDLAISKALGVQFSYQNYWVPWLQSIARDTADPGAIGAWQKAARWTRHRGTVFKLGFRETTLIAQVAGHFNGLRLLQEMLKLNGINPKVAKTRWIDGLWRAMGGFNPLEVKRVVEDVWSRSKFMRDRIGTANRDLRDVVREAKRVKTISNDVGAFALELIARVQYFMVDLPIWLAAYKAAEVDMKLSPERALKFADSVVRKSQGGGTKLDQSQFERGGAGGSEFLKMATMFYSYNNVVYNQLRSSGRTTESVRDVPAFLASYLMYTVGPGIFSAAVYALVKGRWPDRDEDDYDSKMRAKLATILVGDAASTVPVIRDTWVIGLGERPRSASALDIFAREGVDLMNITDEQDLMFDILRLGALAKGLPGDRILRGAEDVLKKDD